MSILLACDRSGGHIFPALCLARYREKGRVVLYAPSRLGRSIGKTYGIRVLGIPLPFRNVLLEGILRLCEAPLVLMRIRPSKIIGFGGRDTFFLIILSWFLRIETALYEPNYRMGKANRVLSCIVGEVFCGFPSWQEGRRRKTVGIPVRSSLRRIEKEEAALKGGFDPLYPVLLVCGGSQGATFINEVARDFVQKVSRRIQVIHITGARQYSEICRFYDTINIVARVYAFCEQMEYAYSCADAAIVRAGALTVAEIIYYRIPAVFIPYPAAGGHQVFNAVHLVKNDAAVMFHEEHFCGEDFRETVLRLLTETGTRAVYQKNLEKLNIAVSCEEFRKAVFPRRPRAR